MPLMNGAERAFAGSIARLSYENPFLPGRIALERAALGDEFVASAPVWTVRADREVQNPNVERLHARVETLAATLRERMVAGRSEERRVGRECGYRLLC